VIITESPIDALSVAVMEQLKFKEGYFRSHKIATCGHPKTELKWRIRKLFPRRLWLYYDNDAAGRRINDFTHHLMRGEFACQSIPYTFGKDPNDVLRIRQSILS